MQPYGPCRKHKPVSTSVFQDFRLRSARTVCCLIRLISTNFASSHRGEQLQVPFWFRAPILASLERGPEARMRACGWGWAACKQEVMALDRAFSTLSAFPAVLGAGAFDDWIQSY